MCCRGTGEEFNGANNTLSHVTRKLDSALFRPLGDVPYPASLGAFNQTFELEGVSEAQSIDEGVPALVTMIEAAVNPVVLLGYSLGSEVVSAFLEDRYRGAYPQCQVVAAGLIANPRRRAGDSFDTVGASGYGINGEHAPWPQATTTFEICNERDVIASCPAGSPLRALGDGMSAFSFAGLGWSQDLIDRLLKNRWQPVSWGWWQHPYRTYQLYAAAATLVDGYLRGGQHNHAYIDNGYTDVLAAALDNFAKDSTHAS